MDFLFSIAFVNCVIFGEDLLQGGGYRCCYTLVNIYINCFGHINGYQEKINLFPEVNNIPFILPTHFDSTVSGLTFRREIGEKSIWHVLPL